MSHSDPLVMQMESSNCPPIHVGLGIFAVFSHILFHRLLSSTFVGLFRSPKPFLASSTVLVKVSVRSVTLVTGADMILGIASENCASESSLKYDRSGRKIRAIVVNM